MLKAVIREADDGKPYISLRYESNGEPFAPTEQYESDRNMIPAIAALGAHGIPVVDERPE
jgi:hypothetical protein